MLTRTYDGAENDLKQNLCYLTKTSTTFSPSSYSSILSLSTSDSKEVFTTPRRDIVWERGQAARIEWDADELESDNELVTIELRRRGSAATTMISKGVENSGTFMYRRVPWGMMTGDGYYIVLSSGASRYVSKIFRIGTSPSIK